MRALGKLKKEEGVWLYDAPKPEIQKPSDVLIKMSKASICGTDLHIYNWDEWAQQTIPVPMTIGHEGCGVVEKVGSEVKAFKPGDRVVIEGHVTCGTCRNCLSGKRHLCINTKGVGVNRTGLFAEYLVVPETNIYHLPNEISDSIGAIMDPLGNAVHTALSFKLEGQDVLITGAGPIGIMAAAIARHVGARDVVITDVNEYRLELAKKMNPNRVVDVRSESLEKVMKEIEMKEGFDVGLEMSGNDKAFNAMIDAMNHGGSMALLGILPDGVPIAWTKIIFKSLTIKGIYGREIFETWHIMVHMLQSGLDVSSVITHHFPLEDFQQAFDVVRAGKSGKVVLDIN